MKGHCGVVCSIHQHCILCRYVEPHSCHLGGKGEWQAVYLFARPPAAYIPKDGTDSQFMGTLMAAMQL